MNYIKIILIQPYDHCFNIITKRSSFFIFPFLLSLCTVFIEKPSQSLSFKERAPMAS